MEAKHSRDGLNPTMRFLGFRFEKEPIYHYVHKSGLIKFPVGGTVNIWIENQKQTFAVMNRQAYVANRVHVDFEGWKENFPDNPVAWQEVNLRIAKHGAVEFTGIFVPLCKTEFNRTMLSPFAYPELKELPQKYFIRAITLFPSGPTEILSPFHVRFECATQDVSPYIESVDETLPSESVDHSILTHASDTEEIFEEEIADWDAAEEITISDEELRKLLNKEE